MNKCMNLFYFWKVLNRFNEKISNIIVFYSQVFTCKYFVLYSIVNSPASATMSSSSYSSSYSSPSASSALSLFSLLSSLQSSSKTVNPASTALIIPSAPLQRKMAKSPNAARIRLFYSSVNSKDGTLRSACSSSLVSNVSSYSPSMDIITGGYHSSLSLSLVMTFLSSWLLLSSLMSHTRPYLLFVRCKFAGYLVILTCYSSRL